MNTPAPCYKCEHLLYNVMEEDNPQAAAWCGLELPMGCADCPRFSEEERDKVPPRPLTAEQVWERMREKCSWHISDAEGHWCDHPDRCTVCLIASCPLLKEDHGSA